MKRFAIVLLILLSVFSAEAQRNISGKTPKKQVNLSTADYTNGIPSLAATAEFIEPSGNNLLDAEETAKIKITITNSGDNSAFDVGVNVSVDNRTNLSYNQSSKTFGEIKPNQTVVSYINISANQNIQNSTRKFNISFSEYGGFIARPIAYEIQTQKLLTPSLVLIETGIKELNGNGNNIIEQGELILATVLIQNKGQGTAVNSKYQITGFGDGLIATKTNDYPIIKNLGNLEPGKTETIQFAFSASWAYNGSDILPLKIILSESRGSYGGNYSLGLKLNVQQLAADDMHSDGNYHQDVNIQDVSLTSDVDNDIPQSSKTYPNRFALIIGNQNYKFLSPLTDAYTLHDAEIFKQYAVKTLGIPENNTYLIPDASSDDLNANMPNTIYGKLLNRLDANSEIIVYYSGHGMADNDGNGYFLPINANIGFNNDTKQIDIFNGVKISDFLEEISTKNPKLLVVFTDACFSGSDKGDASVNQDIAKVRMVQIQKINELPDNTIYFSATTDASPAYPYTDQQHGLFTYALLKSLKNSNGNITYSQLFSEISTEMNTIVNGASFNFKSTQTPTHKETKQGWATLKVNQ